MFPKLVLTHVETRLAESGGLRGYGRGDPLMARRLLTLQPLKQIGKGTDWLRTAHTKILCRPISHIHKIMLVVRVKFDILVSEELFVGH